jgi:hypothetical protein
LHLAHTCPPTPLRYGDATQWRAVPGSAGVETNPRIIMKYVVSMRSEKGAQPYSTTV